MNEKNKSGTQRVREVIHEMGFSRPNPPTGWHQQVQAKLKAEGVQVNDSLVYKQRRELANDGGGRKARRGKRPPSPMAVTAAEVMRDTAEAQAIIAKGDAGRLVEYEQAWGRISASGMSLGDFAKINSLAWRLAGESQSLDAGYIKLQSLIADLRTLESFRL
jgi:hypothetical protein